MPTDSLDPHVPPTCRLRRRQNSSSELAGSESHDLPPTKRLALG